jgi:hypothetical protein
LWNDGDWLVRWLISALRLLRHNSFTGDLLTRSGVSTPQSLLLDTSLLPLPFPLI